MSDIEDLAEIAEQHAISYRPLSQVPARYGRHAEEYCGGGHLWTETNTRWHKDRRGRNRRTCRICDKARATCRRNADRMRTASEPK